MITSSDSPDFPRPVVIGGGVAGLTAALHLAAAGLRPLVLEAQPRPGGRLQGGEAVTLEHRGRVWAFPSEHGIHGFWSQYHNLRAALRQHGITPAFVPSQGQEWVYGDGNQVRRAELGRILRHSFVPAPFHYLALFSSPRFWAMFRWWEVLLLPWVGGALLATLAVEPMAEGADLDGLTLADLLDGWPPMLRAFVVALARSGLAADPRTVPLAGFLAFLRFYTLMSRDAGAFDYLAGDAGAEIVAPLVAAIERAGGTVATGVEATTLEPGEGGWAIEYEGGKREAGSGKRENGGNGGASFLLPASCFLASHVILATDAPGTRRLLEASPALTAGAAKLRWPAAQPTVVVRVWFSRSPEGGEESGLFGGNFALDNFFWLHRFQPSFRAWHDVTGGSAIEAHLYSPPELLEQPDTVVLAHAVSDVVRAWPALRGAVVHTAVQRNPATHTLFNVGTKETHLGVTTPWPGLFCCGDWLRHPSPAMFLERAAVTGTAAANEVLAAAGHPAVPLLPHDEPEPLVAGIEWLARRAFAAMKASHRSPPDGKG